MDQTKKTLHTKEDFIECLKEVSEISEHVLVDCTNDSRDKGLTDLEKRFYCGIGIASSMNLALAAILLDLIEQGHIVICNTNK